MYCVYLTTYTGSKLPMFYIGSGKIENIIKRNYHGSVRSKAYGDIWKSEIKHNPHLFKTKILKEFNNNSDALKREEYLHRKLNVVKSPMYINKVIANTKFHEVISGRFTSENTSGDKNHQYGKPLTQEHKDKISATLKKNYKPYKIIRTPERKEELRLKWSGPNSPAYGKKASEETREKLRIAITGIKRSDKFKEDRTGYKNGRAVPVIIDGIYYGCKKEECDKLNISGKALSKIIKSQGPFSVYDDPNIVDTYVSPN